MNTNRNRVNKQKKHTHHIHRNIKLQRVSVKLSDTPFFRTPLFVWEKFEPPFWEDFENSSSSFMKEWGSTYIYKVNIYACMSH